ncbi:hypothetical protein GQ53DRAFT_755913 [Thozetella sp. PMI_491]|nr:hypothetical protein GQ53DRAFT_755913 [Thozetella sp. PMI_491]
MSNVDVLIVGAGPVGVTLALELALQKVSFRLVDKEPVRSDKSRALVVQPRSQELLDRHGATADLVARGKTIDGVHILTDRRYRGSVDLTNVERPDTRFKEPLVISQHDTEQFLDACLARYGYAAERPVTAKDIVQDAEGVSVTLEKPTGEEKLRARYVVGCDGAHSTVRRASHKFAFKGAAYPQDFVLCDAHIRDSNLDRHRLYLGMSRGVFAVFPMGDDIVRLVAAGIGIVSDEEPQLEHFQRMLDDSLPSGAGTLSSSVWLARFRLHHRGVDAYRDGRLFLAGDAAHIHSPAGGQGMNVGMQDAINLGWKLARVLRGEASDALLESYHAERYPVGRALLNGTDRAFSFFASTSQLFMTVRNFFLPWLVSLIASSKSVREAAYGFISEFDVAYRSSPIVGTAKGYTGPLRGGDRLPDARIRRGGRDGAEMYVQQLCVGSSHHLILFEGSGQDAVPEGGLEAVKKVLEAPAVDAEVHLISSSEAPSNTMQHYDPEGKAHSQYGFTKAGYLYVRPDGYIAHVGLLTEANELLTRLASLVQ